MFAITDIGTQFADDDRSNCRLTLCWRTIHAFRKKKRSQVNMPASANISESHIADAVLHADDFIVFNRVVQLDELRAIAHVHVIYAGHDAA